MTTSPSLSPQSTRPAAIAPWWHTVLLLVIVLGIAALQGNPRVVSNAEHMSSRIPIYISTLVYELFLFGFVWLGLRARRVGIREIIGGRWSRFSDFLIDVATMILFWMTVIAVLLNVQIFVRYNGVKAAGPLLPQAARELIFFVVLSLAAGFCEEFIFRGYLQRQFLAFAGKHWIAIAAQAFVFGAGHYYQGWRPVIAITIYGALFGILAWLRKSLRPGMMQHGLQDAAAGIAIFIVNKYHLVKLG